MRSPDNLAKYAAGGRDRMAVAAGRDHFSPTNQPVAMCAKTFHKMFKPQPPSSQPSLNKSPSVAHLNAQIFAADVQKGTNTGTM